MTSNQITILIVCIFISFIHGYVSRSSDNDDLDSDGFIVGRLILWVLASFFIVGYLVFFH